MNRAPFPYPGSKARHADWILEHIPEHRTYVEPFGGAAGVLFAKPKSKVEVYNDRDGDLVQFFEVLRERPDDLVEWLEAVPFAREVHDEWAEAFYHEDYRPDDPVERAGRFFALRYMQFGGDSTSKVGFKASTTSNEARPFKNKVDVLRRFSERFRGVCVENLDWSEVVGRYDNHGTVFYCDPPYIDAEGYYSGEALDHRTLHDTLTGIDGDAVVSYDSIPPFYGDEWQVVARDADFRMNHSGTGPKDATEYLLMNFDADGTPIMSDVGQQDLAEFES